MYGLFFHEGGYAHDTGPGHPERPERLDAVRSALTRFQQESDASTSLDVRPARREELVCVHSPDYVDKLLSFAAIDTPMQLDSDTRIASGSVHTALEAAGAGVAAVAAVLSGAVQHAFCGVRPPGHHAEPNLAMGFCLFNSIAVAGQAALQSCERIAILDFDVHHGNGTQAMMWDESRALFASSHEMPLYPGSGAASECGAHGQIYNVPLQAGAGDDMFLKAWEVQILPRVKDFQPDLILVSAGFDAHARDPLANLNVSSEAFGVLGQRLADLAADVCEGRIVSLLEGGYDLIGLEDGLFAYLSGLSFGGPRRL